jgi:hypothetical protein
MKKLFVILAAAFVAASCSSSAKLINTSSHATFSDPQLFVTAVYADLDIKDTKITYFYIPSKTVANGGLDNIIDSAVSEALVQNNNADVLVGLQKQVKYNSVGEIESVVITGYPAHYTNMRSAGEKYFEDIKCSGAQSNGAGSLVPSNLIKVGKK